MYVKTFLSALIVGSIILMVSIGLLCATLISPWEYKKFLIIPQDYKTLLLDEDESGKFSQKSSLKVRVSESYIEDEDSNNDQIVVDFSNASNAMEESVKLNF